MLKHDHMTVAVASPPWRSRNYYRPSEEKKIARGNQHKGWTMVSTSGWFWATLDTNINERFRVCRESIPFGEALRTFRKKVDEKLNAKVEVEG